MTDLSVNLAVHPRDAPITELNGPGRRIPLWVQGCVHRCTDDCIAIQLLEDRPRYVLPVLEVLEFLDARRRRDEQGIEGLTFLGGEPTEQATALCEIAREVRKWGWSVMTYSGHTIQNLLRKNEPAIAALLEESDILVDGPFIKHLANPMLRWRGSSNQKIYLFGHRYGYSALSLQPVLKGTDISLTTDGRVLVSGVQDKELVERIILALKNNGVISDCETAPVR